jgi:hypothetical protein
MDRGRFPRFPDRFFHPFLYRGMLDTVKALKNSAS